MKWLINSRGDAVKLSDSFRLFATKYETENHPKWTVFASTLGDDFPVEYFETKDEANAYIRELVKQLNEEG